MNQTQLREVLTLTQLIKMPDMNHTESLDWLLDTGQVIQIVILLNLVIFSEKLWLTEKENIQSQMFSDIFQEFQEIFKKEPLRTFSRLIQNTEMVLEDFWDSALSNQEFDQSQAFICQRIIYKTLNEIIWIK